MAKLIIENVFGGADDLEVEDDYKLPALAPSSWVTFAGKDKCVSVFTNNLTVVSLHAAADRPKETA